MEAQPLAQVGTTPRATPPTVPLGSSCCYWGDTAWGVSRHLGWLPASLSCSPRPAASQSSCDSVVLTALN